MMTGREMAESTERYWASWAPVPTNVSTGIHVEPGRAEIVRGETIYSPQRWHTDADLAACEAMPEDADLEAVRALCLRIGIRARMPAHWIDAEGRVNVRRGLR